MSAQWQPSASLHNLKARSRLLADIRRFFAMRDVLEVDTPILAAAAPCEAQLACLEVAGAGHLVPSPEYAMKRLLAAGMGDIYQLGPVFRAGEQGRWHNPEFCMLEWYRVDWDMVDLIDELEALFTEIAGTGPFIRNSFAALFEQFVALDAHQASAAELAGFAKQQGIAPDYLSAQDQGSRVFWLDLIMSVYVIPKLGLKQPLCITGFPSDDALLIELTTDQPPLAKRFEVYWQGVELANGAQELTCQNSARRRMRREQHQRQVLGLPASSMDEKLLASLDAMPKSTGVAVGVDRLLALKLGADSIGPVLPFSWSTR